MDIIKLLNALSKKVDVLGNDYDVADVQRSGLFDKQEAPAMITGLFGGKGALPDGTDIDTVLHGGIYYLPKENNYPNVPFVSSGGNYRMELRVARNYSGNQRTDNPLVVQEIRTLELETGLMRTAYRFYFGKFQPWNFPYGQVLWSGSQATNGQSFTLAKAYSAFDRLEFVWQPYNKHTEIQQSSTTASAFTISSFNTPDSAPASPAGSLEEVNLVPSADGTTLKATSSVYYVQDGFTYNSDDSGKSKIIKINGYTDRQVIVKLRVNDAGEIIAYSVVGEIEEGQDYTGVVPDGFTANYEEKKYLLKDDDIILNDSYTEPVTNDSVNQQPTVMQEALAALSYQMMQGQQTISDLQQSNAQLAYQVMTLQGGAI